MICKSYWFFTCICFIIGWQNFFTYLGHSSLSQAQNFPTWSLSHLHFPHSQSPLLLQISPESGFCMHFFVCSTNVLTPISPMSHSHCLPENPELRKIIRCFWSWSFKTAPSQIVYFYSNSEELILRQNSLLTCFWRFLRSIH